MPIKKRTITAEDLYRFELIVEPRLSPDGNHIVFNQSRVDRKTEEKYANLWVVPFSGGEPRQFTHGDQIDSHPRWSPDGRQIAFLSDRGDKEKKPQIYLIQFDGGEAHPVTGIDGEILDFAWSPSGKQLLCTIRKLDPEAVQRQGDEQKKKLGVVSRRYDRVFYKLDGYGYLPLERTHLWLVDTKTRRATQITDHPVHDQLEPAWSPDGKSIVFHSNIASDPDFYPDYDDLFVMPAAGGEPHKLPTPVGYKSQPVFSPDGRWIAYYGAEGEGTDYKNQGLWVIPVDGSGASCNLTAAYDLHCSPWTINDQGSLEQMPPTWSNDSQRLYFTDSYHGSSLLRSIGIDGSSLQNHTSEGGVIGSYTFDKSQSRLAYFYGNMQDTGQIYVRDLSIKNDRCLTKVNRAWLDRIDLGHVEETWFKGADGNDLQGWVLTPPGLTPRKSTPRY